MSGSSSSPKRYRGRPPGKQQPGRMVKLQVFVPEALAKWLAKRAAQLGVGVTQAARMELEERRQSRRGQ